MIPGPPHKMSDPQTRFGMQQIAMHLWWNPIRKQFLASCAVINWHLVFLFGSFGRCAHGNPLVDCFKQLLIIHAVGMRITLWGRGSNKLL
jgi:hypothetical protein